MSETITTESLISVDKLQTDLLKYRKRRKFLEKTIFHLTRELELIINVEKAVNQAFDYAKEAERELEKFGKPPKKKVSKLFKNKCTECLTDFMASWKGRKYCEQCMLKNPNARAAARARRMAMEN